VDRIKTQLDGGHDYGRSEEKATQPPTMYLRQAGLTRNPTFSYLYCVRCRGQDAASKAPLERKYSRCVQPYEKSGPDDIVPNECRISVWPNILVSKTKDRV